MGNPLVSVVMATFNEPVEYKGFNNEYIGADLF